MRRALAVLLAASTLPLAACGYEGTVTPTAERVSGTLPEQRSTLPQGNAAAGKKVFADNGCGGCHTFKPAGTNAKIGPDLDNLAEDAQKANQGPLAEFVETSIVNPSAYVEPGYNDLMPKQYGNLPQEQLADLVAFLTQKQ